MDETHSILLEAVKHNQALIEAVRRDTGKDIANCKSDVIKLKYYIYTLASIIVVMLGKPEWIAVLL